MKKKRPSLEELWNHGTSEDIQAYLNSLKGEESNKEKNLEKAREPPADKRLEQETESKSNAMKDEVGTEKGKKKDPRDDHQAATSRNVGKDENTTEESNVLVPGRYQFAKELGPSWQNRKRPKRPVPPGRV